MGQSSYRYVLCLQIEGLRSPTELEHGYIYASSVVAIVTAIAVAAVTVVVNVATFSTTVEASNVGQ